MTEAAVWETLRAALVQSPKDDAIRVENPAHPGTPDVSWCMNGIEGWLELKHLPHWPKRADTIVRIDHFTPQQRVWLRRRHLAGGRVHLLLKAEAEWLLFTGIVAANHVGKLPREELREKAIMRCTPLFADSVRSALRGDW